MRCLWPWGLLLLGLSACVDFSSDMDAYCALRKSCVCGVQGCCLLEGAPCTEAACCNGLVCSASGVCESPVPAALRITPSVFRFGMVQVTGDSEPQTTTLRVTNTGGGTTSPLEVREGQYRSFPGDASDCEGRSLAPGASCELRLALWPRRLDSRPPGGQVLTIEVSAERGGKAQATIEAPRLARLSWVAWSVGTEESLVLLHQSRAAWQECSATERLRTCQVGVYPGLQVTLRALVKTSHTTTGPAVVRWSREECPTPSSECTFVVAGDTEVVADFGWDGVD